MREKSGCGVDEEWTRCGCDVVEMWMRSDRDAGIQRIRIGYVRYGVTANAGLNDGWLKFSGGKVRCEIYESLTEEWWCFVLDGRWCIHTEKVFFL